MHRYTILVDGKPFTIDIRELGPDQFRVNVGGRELDVTLGDDQELHEGSITPAMLAPDEDVAATEPQNTALPASLPAASQRLRARGGTESLTAPMPGVIVSIDVKPGMMVSRGDALLTLEAMKMRNAIRAPRDAVIDEVLVSDGESVAFGAPLIRFRESS